MIGYAHLLRDGAWGVFSRSAEVYMVIRCTLDEVVPYGYLGVRGGN